MKHGIRIGVGGWTFAPWRGAFYPPELRQADELRYVSRRLGALEINATYHSLQSAESFRRWADQAPEDFVFTVKGSRYCTNRHALGEAGESVERFIGQGLAELGGRLGPILWQFMPTKKFDREDFGRFLDLLPATIGGRELRHCMEVRHPSFADEAFVRLCRDRGVAICLADHPTYPQIEEATADFAYARLMRLEEEIPDGYPADALDAWAGRLGTLEAGGRPVFAFFIGAGGEGKVRAPAAAEALMSRLGQSPSPDALDLLKGTPRKSAKT
ncbi:MAG TPA: DUF72 domain-containing protein [Caulobacteraceae bacterium]|jgi:uncharacterized protein YecE (DUF72 family)